MHAPRAWLAGLLLVVALGPAAALDGTLRNQEIAQCLPGEAQTWGDGRDRPAVSASMVFVYDHAGAPAWLDAALVMDVLKTAAAAWSGCGVPGTVLRAERNTPYPPDAVRVGWNEATGRAGNFGLANLGAKTLSLGPAAFELLKARNPNVYVQPLLQMVVAHEMGHLYGVVAHSRRCVDVTSYYSNARGEKCSIRGGGDIPPGVEYRASLPTACDLQRCRAANGMTAPR